MTTPLDVTGPAIALACELEAAGFTMGIASDNITLQVRPREQITRALDHRIRAHRHELMRLVRMLDDGVVIRRDHFRCQWLRRRLGDPIGPFLFRSDVPYTAPVCFSCGDPNDGGWGRCWRCRLAWRLAVGLPAASDASLVEQDEAKRVA